MRTTVSLDPDTDAVVRRLMRERGMSFKRAINAAIRAGVAGSTGSQPMYRTPSFEMGVARLPLDKAHRLAAELEDDELIGKLAARK